MTSSGYFRVGSIRGADVLVHASVLVILLFVRPQFAVLLSIAGYFFLVLVHELGHAAVTWTRGLRVRHVTLHLFGGECSVEGYPTEFDAIALAWGGVLAQFALFVVAYAAVLAHAPLPDAFMVWPVAFNLPLAAFNLIPIAGLDGAVAWKIIPYAFRKLTARRPKKANPRRPLTIKSVSRGPFAGRRESLDDLVVDDAEAERLAAKLLVERALANPRRDAGTVTDR